MEYCRVWCQQLPATHIVETAFNRWMSKRAMILGAVALSANPRNFHAHLGDHCCTLSCYE